MINKSELSKYKYIYRIYATDDKVIHCEKYPVIYSNSEIVYFKDARKRECLNYTTFGNIHDEYLGITSRDLNYYGHYDNYFWKVENFNSREATEEAFEQKNKDELEKAKSIMERTEREYLQAKAKYEKLNNNTKL